ncbi:hypothetical protein CMI38_05080 [Candidatus Pacearchaeota archaeon]|nr:hypothetical protein [Candidatus Pacearchaeota archaeon]|tara:strand:+ start:4519 stop:5031 length:513 start_codon:yes stop_codon:yes gene_type:complete
MPTCQNCNYELVLLPRGKYKCSICSKLYPPKKVESKSFRTWNQKQRELDIHNDKLDHKNKVSEKREIRKFIRQLFNGLPKTRKQIYEEYKEVQYQKKKLWIQNNKDKYLEMRRKMREKYRQRIRGYANLYYYRKKQKALALHYLRNKQYNGSKEEIDFSVPASSLSQLLF